MDQLKEYFDLVDNSTFFRMDYPDIDIIRVDDTYYCITTTMHFFPGAEILSSKDLVHWKHQSYVYDVLDSTKAQTLEEGSIYGKGMWAATLRYHNGEFFVCFVANDTGKTYLYRSKSIDGPYTKSTIEGFFHDCSLLFDDDGKTYIIYGNKKIFITELNEELNAPKEGGLNKLLIEDVGNPMLGFEGAKAHKINGTYYFFFIHSKHDRWRRCEACYYTDSLDKELTGGDLDDYDLGYKGSGIAQGCIIDDKNGNWHAVLFQDRGASGRIPVLMPFHFEGKKPVLESPLSLKKAEHVEQPDVFKESFLNDELDVEWQWNHEPDLSLVKFGKDEGGLKIKSAKLCDDILKTKNVLTRKLVFPSSYAKVMVDASALKDGDCAGICAFLGSYGAIMIERKSDRYLVKMLHHEAAGRDKDASDTWYLISDDLQSPEVELAIKFSFGGATEDAEFFVNGQAVKAKKNIFFALDHFTGCRAALFMYSTKETGGEACFKDFELRF